MVVRLYCKVWHKPAALLENAGFSNRDVCFYCAALPANNYCVSGIDEYPLCFLFDSECTAIVKTALIRTAITKLKCG